MDSWVTKIHWRRNRLPTPGFLGFHDGSAGKESTCNVETWVQSLGWEDPLEKGKATHFRFAKIWTQLSDFHSHVH